MDIRVKTSGFVTSASQAKGYPAPDLPEIAFAGRSNVGKSSLINALAGRKKLVRVSNTPGRTRLLNFFTAEVAEGEKTHALRFCDLPGYGYAKIAKVERAKWEALIEDYLQGRARLCGVVLIVDAEVGPTPQDLQMLAWLAAAGRPVIPVATKIDRLSKARRFPALRKVEAGMSLPVGSILGVSSTEPLGLDEVWRRIVALASPPG